MSTLSLGLWCIHNLWCSYIKRFPKLIFLSDTCQHDNKDKKQMWLAPFCLHNFKTQSIMKNISKELNLNFNWKGKNDFLPTHDNGRHKDCLTFKIIKFEHKQKCFRKTYTWGGMISIKKKNFIATTIIKIERKSQFDLSFGP